VKKLITQTLDPLLSAFFRDVAHKKTMLELLHDRDKIQQEARKQLQDRFREFDNECVDVLIGKPDTDEKGGKIEVLLEQLRQRQLSVEQLETYEKQRVAAERLRSLHEAQATAQMQTQLTNTRVQVQIAESQAEADLARARRQAEQTIVTAEAELARSRRQAEQTVVLAEAECQKQTLTGRGESRRALQVGLADAAVLNRKVSAFGDPRLYATARVTESLARSSQPLVPERLFVAAGGNGDGSSHTSNGLVGTLLSMLVGEKSGFALADTPETKDLKLFADRMANKTMDSMLADSASGEGIGELAPTNGRST
jgi:regulator of protease activity HflC (stomatin/prohibitin superfamily)